jgi:hypothetical protein
MGSRADARWHGMIAQLLGFAAKQPLQSMRAHGTPLPRAGEVYRAGAHRPLERFVYFAANPKQKREGMARTARTPASKMPSRQRRDDLF